MTILDATVRDGSYAVDFKFSSKDVQDLVSKSEKIGLEYIEIGHGLGLNASGTEHGVALQTDVEYMHAARQVAKNAKLGFFCIPDIARLEDIVTAAKNEMNFIRIGVPVHIWQKALPYIYKGREEGLEVFINFMKTYAAPPSEFGEAAKNAYAAGAQTAYIVDSAGNMTTDEIDRYIHETREKSDIKIGFHGHNNLGLAVSNTLHCVEVGVEFIDCTFQGLGRSIGNASLEQVVMALEKIGYSTGYDIPRVLEYGYSGLRNIVRRDLVNPLDYMCGYTGFHSSFLKDIYRCCNEKKVDPLRLIMAYSKENKLTMDYTRLCMIADTLPRDPDDNPYNFGKYFSDVYNYNSI